jgi:hypothetical protein
VSQNISKSIVITGITVGILAGCVVGGYFLGGANLMKTQTEQGGGAAAKAQLTAAAVAVDIYASQNGGFSGLSARGMSAIDTQTKWVDGEPGAGQVGIIESTDATYVIAFRDAGGAVYKASKAAGGLVVTDSSGNKI